MKRTPFYWIVSGLCALAMLMVTPAQGAGLQTLRGHVPAIAAGLQPTGNLPATNRLHLAISLPLRNHDVLTNLLHDIYNPASPDYRHYLTPQEFTAQFGPEQKDVQAVVEFAKTSGFTVTKTHANRVIVDVDASVADIEKAFHVKMRTYAHPSGKRFFYAPDAEPTVALPVPLAHISGLDDASPPQPRVQVESITNASAASPNFGSGIFGTYAGGDFRAAYVPGTTLTGAGQVVGLVQFDGYNLSDITNYETEYGMTNVPLTNVFLDGFTGATGANQLEVTLDIEMTVAMAPGLAGVILYDAGPSGNWHDVLNQMANDNIARQLSCSWFIPNGPADPVADGIFQQMALQGQSFFDATGDVDAFTGLIPFPSDNPYITQVGGTRLTTTGPGGSYVSEKAWNRNNGIGSSGGISTQYSIPDYQVPINMTNNQGSTRMRNIPDVALTSESVDVFINGGDTPVGGTSCAAPLWAGFAALVNQQAASLGRPPLGFANPTLTAIGLSTNYALCFNDITNGSNTNASSPTRFFATNGYDLCTGWGTPDSAALINALVNPEPLLILPTLGFASVGQPGGPFSVTNESLTLTNTGTNVLNWTLTNPVTWLTVSPTSGSLTNSGPATTVNFSLNAAATNLAAGVYRTVIWFTNLNDNYVQGFRYSLSVLAPPVITAQPTNETILDGQSAMFSVGITGGPLLVRQWQLNGTNLTDGGNISGSITDILTITNASITNAGTYTFMVTNAEGSAVSSNAVLTIASSAPVITQQPAAQSNFVGGGAMFSVAAVGTKPFSYQWTFEGTNLAAATNSMLMLTNLQPVWSGNYAVIVSNSVGPTSSSNATLTVITVPPAITSQPVGAGAYVGDQINFAVAASGSPPLSYQWLFNGASISGATNATLALANVQTGQSGVYAAQVTSPYGLATSSDADLFVAQAVTCDPPPVNIVSWWKAEANALDAVSTNNGTLTNGVGYGPGEVGQAFVFSGSNSAVLLGNSPDLQVQDFTVEMWIQRATGSIVSNAPDELLFAGCSGGYGFGLTSSGQLFLEQIDSNKVTITNCVMDTNWHHVAVTKITSLVKFYIDGVAYPAAAFSPTFAPGNVAIGARADNLSSNFFGSIDEAAIYSRALADGEVQFIYQAGASGKCPPPVGILTQPISQHVTTNCITSLSVVAGGSEPPLTYQWWQNGVALAGQTNASLPLNSIQSNSFGTYFVVVDNVLGVSAASSNAVISLDHAPVAGSNTVQRFASGGVKIPLSVLLTNASDPDGDPLTLFVSTNSSAGGTVSLHSNHVTYAPPVGFTNTDTFTFTVSDGFCGGTATGLITILVTPDTNAGTYQIQETTNSSIQLNFSGGIPNRAYRIQYTVSLVTTNWQTLGMQTSDDFGSFQFTDGPPTNCPARYYRAISP